MDEGHAVARARPDLRAAPDDVLHRLDEATRIVGQIRDNATGVEQATLARSLFIEERAEESRAAGETVGELSQALGAAVAVAERTAFNAAEQVQQFQVLVERLDRLKQDGQPVIPGSPTSIESAGGASGCIAAVCGRLGKH